MIISDQEGCSAWHPGVESWIPAEYRALETLFRPDCVAISMEEVQWAVDLTRLPAEDLTLYRPERLALHELIIRVAADVAVAEGQEERDLGDNFRLIVRRIFDHDIRPRLPELEAEHAELLRQAEALAGVILARSLEAAPRQDAAPRKTWLARLFGSAPEKARPRQAEESVAERDCRIIAEYKSAGRGDTLEGAVYRSLHRILGALVGRYSRICGEPAALARMAARLLKSQPSSGLTAGAWSRSARAWSNSPRASQARPRLG